MRLHSTFKRELWPWRPRRIEKALCSADQDPFRNPPDKLTLSDGPSLAGSSPDHRCDSAAGRLLEPHPHHQIAGAMRLVPHRRCDLPTAVLMLLPVCRSKPAPESEHDSDCTDTYISSSQFTASTDETRRTMYMAHASNRPLGA